MSVEDASRATKIRPRQIADLEGDEYSNFANLAYAKSFLIAYGKYLRVDMRPYMEAFADASTFGLDDYQYLSEEPLGVYRATRRMPRQSRRLKRRQIILAGTTVGLLAIGLFCRLMYISYERLGDLDKIAARHEARALALQEARPAATTTKAAPTAPAAEDGSVGDGVQPVTMQTVSSHVPIELPALTPPSPAEPVPGPTVPLPGDGAAVREMLTAQTVQKPAYAQGTPVERVPFSLRPPVDRTDEPQPQKVVNNGLNLPVN